MLTCITCSKQKEEDEDESRPSTTKDSVKTITSQIKDMALRLKPSAGSSSGSNRGQRQYSEFDSISEGVPYPFYQGGSSSSTPAWDFPRNDSGLTPGRASVRSCDVVVEDDEDDHKEWMAQVEPGVHITFMTLPNGGNDLKRIRFSREMFNKLEAQRWWGENFDRIMELYNVQRFNEKALSTPARSEDQRDSSFSRFGTTRDYYGPSSNKWNYPYEPTEEGTSQQYPVGLGTSYSGPSRGEMGIADSSRMTTSSRDDASVSYSNVGDTENEWVEEDEPGVYITIRQSADGTRELRRVRFSRERFGEGNAKLWWDENRERIQSQYL